MTLGERLGGSSGRAIQAGALVLLVLVAMGPVLGNSWVQDEGPLIVENLRVHGWSGLWTGFVRSWWPEQHVGGLYRPFAQSLLTLLWGAGDGAVWVFKLANLFCYLFGVAGVWALARRLFPAAPAWVVAALFAVHPVHVEAVAVAVNQGESLVVGVFGFALAWWLDRTTEPVPRWTAVGLIAALYLIALGFKEHALVLPMHLLFLEWYRRRSGEGRLAPRAIAIGVGVLALVGSCFWSIRSKVLGDLTGAAPAFGLSERFGDRVLTMLGVVPEWARLLIWPAHLQADYSPFEVVPWAGWSTAQTLGLLVLVLWGAALRWSIGRRPVVAFGLLWIPVALFPVSNVLVPTGVILAERTLMLASVGVIIALVGAVPTEFWSVPRQRKVLWAGIGTLLFLGAYRSATRMPDWMSPRDHLFALGRDAPASATTQMALGVFDMESGRRREGEDRLRAVIAMAPGGSRPYRLLAHYYRRDGLCAPAIPLMLQTLAIEPIDQHTRLSLVACLLDQGRYGDARAHAVEGSTGRGADIRPAFLAAIATADSAVRVAAPPQTVRLASIPGDHTTIGHWVQERQTP
jgi:hypothetical protein